MASSPFKPTTLSILRVIECKCCKNLGAHEIRAEFGKAYDLRVTSYLIWSYWTPKPKYVDGAKRLGLDLVALGFDGPQRANLLAKPENLISHIANTIVMSKREKRFAEALLESGHEITRKVPALK